MADRSRKVAENVAGNFYVDATCIDCDLCRETAPGNFVRQDKRKYSFVTRQPDGAAELATCRAAMEECPVEAIGDDGG
jgi:ferredoxin